MSKSMPLVSIGMPVYNGERFLERAIRSLQQQDYTNIEIVISDNCSSDSTAEICTRLMAEDKRVRYYVNATNIGAVPNFVRVFSLAKGEYFMWAAHDDLWDKHCVTHLAEELQNNPQAGLAFSGITLLDDTGRILSVNAFPTTDDPNCWTCTETALRCASPARGRPKLNYAMYGLFRAGELRKIIFWVRDVAMWDRVFVILAAMAFPFRYCPEPLYQRTLQDQRADERYMDDNYSRQVRENQWWRGATVRHLAMMLTMCPRIPLLRKFFVPFLLWRFGVSQWRKRKDVSKKRRHVSAYKKTGVFAKIPKQSRKYK